MAEYRTIAVKASVSPDIGVRATLTTDRPGVTAVATEADRIVTASASVSGSSVDASASAGDMSVEAEAEITTQVAAGGYPTYKGPHEVTPKTKAQTLKTERKLVLSDITVLEVPYWETSNTSGKTAYIASEV